MAKLQYLVYLGLIFVFLLSSSQGQSQRNSFKMMNSKKIEFGRYTNIEGSPYLFKEWKIARTISDTGEVFDSLLVNYNGQTQSIEVRRGNVYIDLDQRTYPIVQINDGDRKGPIYLQNLNAPPLIRSYARIVYAGQEIYVVEHFESRIETKTNITNGVKNQFSVFVPQKKYYYIRMNKAVEFRLKKKHVFGILGFKKELKSFMKNQDIKLKSEEDLVKILQFYENQEFQKLQLAASQIK